MWQRELTFTVIIEAERLSDLPWNISSGIADALPKEWWSLDGGDPYRIAMFWQTNAKPAYQARRDPFVRHPLEGTGFEEVS